MFVEKLGQAEKEENQRGETEEGESQTLGDGNLLCQVTCSGPAEGGARLTGTKLLHDQSR